MPASTRPAGANLRSKRRRFASLPAEYRSFGRSAFAAFSTTSATTLGSTSFADEYRQAAGASLAASTSRVLDRYLNVLPTITIREGFRITVYLTNDLELPAFTELAGGTQ